MELEGFGAPLQGRALYVCASPEKAWIPWEFISGGTPYNYKILVTGEGPSDAVRHIEHSHVWNAVLRPHAPKDWSCLATIVRSMGPVVLLVFDTTAPPAPSSFISFMDTCLAEHRMLLTRVWIGTHIEIPTIPDAIFFPVLDAHSAGATDVYDMCRRLPARAAHGAWAAMTPHEWTQLVSATHTNGLGIVISDVNEGAWTLFWHKIQDSAVDPSSVLLKRGFMLLHTGMAIVDRARGGL